MCCDENEEQNDSKTFESLLNLAGLTSNEKKKLLEALSHLQRADLPTLWIVILCLFVVCMIIGGFVMKMDVNNLDESKKKIARILAIALCVISLLFFVVRIATFAFLSGYKLIGVFGSDIVSAKATRYFAFMVIFGLVGIGLMFPAIISAEEGDYKHIMYIVLSCSLFGTASGCNRAFHSELVQQSHVVHNQKLSTS